jgi:hypothetical protein
MAEVIEVPGGKIESPAAAPENIGVKSMPEFKKVEVAEAPMTMDRADKLRMRSGQDPEPQNPQVEDSQFEGKFTPEPPLPLPEPIEKGMDDATGYPKEN